MHTPEDRHTHLSAHVIENTTAHKKACANAHSCIHNKNSKKKTTACLQSLHKDNNWQAQELTHTHMQENTHTHTHTCGQTHTQAHAHQAHYHTVNMKEHIPSFPPTGWRSSFILHHNNSLVSSVSSSSSSCLNTKRAKLPSESEQCNRKWESPHHDQRGYVLLCRKVTLYNNCFRRKHTHIHTCTVPTTTGTINIQRPSPYKAYLGYMRSSNGVSETRNTLMSRGNTAMRVEKGTSCQASTTH